MLTLSALNGQDKGRVFQLTGEQPELMGRQAPNIRLTDAQTSRRHAEIILQNNTWLIRDLGSTNGTWVNGQKISQITELEVGDRLVVGRHQFRISAIDDLPAPTPQPKTPQPEPAIGHEDLAAIGAGVDLSEGLAADLLDDDGRDESEVANEVLSDSGIRPAAVADNPAAAKIDTDDDDALIDLDAILGDVIADAPDDAADSGAPAHESPAAPLDLSDELGEDLATPAPSADQNAPADEVDFDIDAMLGPDDADQPSDTTSERQAPPPVVAASDTVPPPTERPDDLDDDVLDLDAVLDDLASDEDADAPALEDLDDQLSIAHPLDHDLSEDAQPQPTQADEDEPDDLSAALDTPQDSPEEAPEEDSLIDIDILASAKPASDWQDEEDTPVDVPADTEQPAPDNIQIDAEPPANEAPASDELDDVDEMLGDLAADLDEAPDAFLVDGSDSGLGFDADADDEASSSHDTDASMDAEKDDVEQVDEVVTTDDDDELLGTSSAQVNEAEKGLLLSPQEQEQAVTSYRRSKIKSVVGLLLLLGALGAAGWYGFKYYDSHANATSTPTTQQPADPAATPGIEQPADYAQPPATNPGTTRPKAPQGPPSDSTPAPTPRPTPDQAAPPMAFPDPFADIAPAFTQPQAEQAQPQTPAGTDEPDPAQLQPQPESTPEPVTPLVPAPDTTPTPDNTPATPDTETAPAGEPATDASSDSGADTEDPSVPGVNSALGTINEPTTTTVAPQPVAETPKAELDLITSVIDAQNKPGDRVAGQAEYAGARKVVYLVDASGSLVDSFPFVLSEMNRAIDELTDDKAFTVVFFGSDGVTEVPPVGLKWADTRNKRRVREWVAPDQGNVNAWGRGDLIQALQHALVYSPDDLIILTDNLTGRQSTQEAIDELLARIEKLVGGKVEMIHVMQFFDRDPQQVLKTIAERFHGTYSRITNKPSPDAQSAADDPLELP